MKTKKFFLLWAVMAVAFTVSSCKDDANKPEPKETSLAGTKWKLVKLIHTETKVERPIFIGDEVFTQFVPTMEFITDSTGYLIYYPYCNKLNDPDFNYDNLLFNINKINPNTTDSFAIYWVSIDPMLALDNIGLFLCYMQYNLLGYRVEGTSLKLFCPDDGFFYYSYDDDGYTKKINQMYSRYGTCTDSNWYNCIVFEEVKE